MEFLTIECHQRQVGIEELYAPHFHPSYGDNRSIEEFSLRHGILEKVKICLIIIEQLDPIVLDKIVIKKGTIVFWT